MEYTAEELQQAEQDREARQMNFELIKKILRLIRSNPSKYYRLFISTAFQRGCNFCEFIKWETSTKWILDYMEEFYQMSIKWGRHPADAESDYQWRVSFENERRELIYAGVMTEDNLKEFISHHFTSFRVKELMYNDHIRLPGESRRLFLNDSYFMNLYAQCPAAVAESC